MMKNMILSGRLYGTGAQSLVEVVSGRVSTLRGGSRDQASADTWIVPGLFDLQVNGFAGRDFCTPRVTVEDVEAAARAQLATGVTRFLPTIITSGLDDMCRELEVLARAIEKVPLVRQMCPGIHVEGPFIHPEDGPRGAHPREHVRPPSIADFERLYAAAEGRIAILTLAPDQPGAAELIAHAAGTRRVGFAHHPAPAPSSDGGQSPPYLTPQSAVAPRVLVALGHHRADAAAIEVAIAAGARMCTHLGNGSDATLPRLDNPIWRQLGEDRLWASFIADGHHLPPATLRCMLRAKTAARSVLVTDAMCAAGMPPGRYPLGGFEVEKTPAGRVVLPGTPYLAGSAADMPLCVTRAIVDGGLTLEQAVTMASLNPAHLLLGEPLEWQPRVGDPANLVELEWSPEVQRLTVRKVAMGEFTRT